MKFFSSKTYVLCLLLTITLNLPTILYGQITSSYTIGGFGSIGSVIGVKTYSSPFIVTGEKCFVVSNGVIKFLPVNTGKFFTTCEVNLDYIRLNIKVYPNPTPNFTVIKFLNQIQTDDLVRVQLYSISGNLVDATDVSQKQLLQGYQYSLGRQVAGIYYLQISSNTILQSFKITKL